MASGNRHEGEPYFFNALKREEQFGRLQAEEYDLLIIGGGITGAGIALDAATRGLKTALVEMQDFAAGTSSRSTKLVHGGLRYLKQLEIGVVAEVGKERAVVYENGPHVTTPEWMLLPIYKGGTFGTFSTSIGLRLYDFLAGVKRSERRKMLGVDETARREPLLKKQGLKGGGYYVEYRTDDARLTIEVMKKAVELGACALSYVKAESLLYDNGRVAGAKLHDELTGRTGQVKAKVTINAAGPWVDTIREKDGSKKGKTLHHTKGVHLVFDQKRFPLGQAVYFDSADGRMLFAIPRDGKTYIGTTDTDFRSDLVHPRMTAADRQYILKAANDMFPSLKLKAEDVESSWAGVRPLIHQEGKSPSEISRRDEVLVSPSGLLSMAGGKLTGYRKMAETVMDQAAAQLAKAGRNGTGDSRTMTLPISGGEVGGSAGYPTFVADKKAAAVAAGLAEPDAERLVRRFGSNIDTVLGLLPEAQEEAIRRKLPVTLLLELLYAIRYEMACKPVDFWIRRSGSLLFDRSRVQRWKDSVHGYMAELFGWSAGDSAIYAEELECELQLAVTPSE
ncbi:glycerol-3-phosphate dehydrogenase/oxidase [Paenibacillus glycanilyticus]|uniref:glycerol-3-phosphate dehydrogenase/oxidase n=1 Tax=Paenibacillus glycanilyticus TaxID=126569 RepID=UPI00203A6AAA|nr:FAD-dependent oxidoreductase [Paenibacillus glycanilyticus]MCM3630731.1 glycerol-3-phosphate dehydrogenase/oxidase [Paenibacillus glycanilyticus]